MTLSFSVNFVAMLFILKATISRAGDNIKTLDHPWNCAYTSYFVHPLLYNNIREAVKNYFCLLWGYPPPTPLADNYFPKKPLAEMGGNPPLLNRQK